MTYVCNGCSKDPCILSAESADFEPLYCPFDKEIEMVAWKPECAKNTEQQLQPDILTDAG